MSIFERLESLIWALPTQSDIGPVLDDLIDTMYDLTEDSCKHAHAILDEIHDQYIGR